MSGGSNGLEAGAVVAVAVAVTNGLVLGPIVWYLLRDVRAAVRDLRGEVSALVVAIALDVSTRPTAPDRARRMAEDLVRDRTDPQRIA